MDELIFPSKLYKIRLVKTERDIFGDPILSHDWDKIVKLLYEDVKQEVFHFAHPKKSGIVYQRNYAQCPVSGNAILTIGRLKDTKDYAIVSIITKSHMYHEPYLALEEIEPAFPNPKILLEIVKRAFNSALRKYGLEVIFELWEGDETSHWRDDRWASFIIELKKHPEIAEKNIGFQQAIEYASIVRDVEEKKQVKTKRSNKSDDIKLYINKGKKEIIVNWLHRVLMGLTSQKEISMPFRLLYDLEVTDRIPYKAVIKEFADLKGILSENRYNDWTNKQRTSCENEHFYKKFKKDYENCILEIKDLKSA